jgi:AraC-like DNA-binding protein/quercetin dioxygenase-like cupin family protein
MSKIRQDAADPPEESDHPEEAGLRVRSLAVTYDAGSSLRPHVHDWDQLIYAASGVMSVRAGSDVWVVPASRAVWMPAGIEHAIGMSGRVAMRTLYLAPGLARVTPERCAVVNVSPLLRELILHTVGLGALDAFRPEHDRVIGLLLDQIAALPSVPLHVPGLSDPRARRAAEWLRAHPDEPAGLERVTRRAGASRRTLERVFRAETGMSLGVWRDQLRLAEALPRLAAGEPVTNVALAVGYANPSAFIARFRQLLGTTPGRYFTRPS